MKGSKVVIVLWSVFSADLASAGQIEYTYISLDEDRFTGWHQTAYVRDPDPRVEGLDFTDTVWYAPNVSRTTVNSSVWYDPATQWVVLSESRSDWTDQYISKAVIHWDWVSWFPYGGYWTLGSFTPTVSTYESYRIERSAEVAPEPAPLGLLAAGGLALRRRRCSRVAS